MQLNVIILHQTPLNTKPLTHSASAPTFITEYIFTTLSKHQRSLTTNIHHLPNILQLMTNTNKWHQTGSDTIHCQTPKLSNNHSASRTFIIEHEIHYTKQTHSPTTNSNLLIFANKPRLNTHDQTLKYTNNKHNFP